MNENATYPHKLWNYHSFLCQSDYSITTKALENNSYKKIKEFHLLDITQYTAKVVHNGMPSIKAKYLRRENLPKEKFEAFHDLSFPDQMKSLEYYCTEWGLYTSNMDAADFGKVPGLELNEIQEAESESFLSFREILNH